MPSVEQRASAPLWVLPQTDICPHPLTPQWNLLPVRSELFAENNPVTYHSFIPAPALTHFLTARHSVLTLSHPSQFQFLVPCLILTPGLILSINQSARLVSSSFSIANIFPVPLSPLPPSESLPFSRAACPISDLSFRRSLFDVIYMNLHFT